MKLRTCPACGRRGVTEKKVAVDELRDLAEQIYEALDQMKEILEKVAPGEVERAKQYWLAHIDGALENRGGWVGGSFISFEDTIENLEKVEVCEECGQELKIDEDD